MVEVRCLGWCDKKFLSPDPTTQRLCPSCRQKKKGMVGSMSKLQLAGYFSEKTQEWKTL